MSQPITLEILGPAPTEEEAAAICAAVAALAAATPSRDRAPLTEPSPWEDSGKLVCQGLAPRKLRGRPAWQTVERLRRDTGGFAGVHGL